MRAYVLHIREQYAYDYLRMCTFTSYMRRCTLHTCRYASEKIRKLEAAGKITRRSRFKSWTLVDLHGFLAIILNMGIIRLPEIEDYWRTSWVGGDSILLSGDAA